MHGNSKKKTKLNPLKIKRKKYNSYVNVCHSAVLLICSDNVVSITLGLVRKTVVCFEGLKG